MSKSQSPVVTELKSKKIGLSVTELFVAVFQALKMQPKVKSVIEFPINVFTEVGDDSDHHRTRIGYMIYKKVLVITVGKTKWLVALATDTKGYPANPYSCDLTITELEKDAPTKSDELIRYTSEIIGAARYFRSSFMTGLNNSGYIASSQITPWKGVTKKIAKKVDRFTHTEPERDRDLLTMDLRPVYSHSTSYKPEFVEFIASIIIDELSKKSELEIEPS